jgi:hypothetical protein
MIFNGILFFVIYINMFKDYSKMSYKQRINYKPSKTTKTLRALIMFVNDVIKNYNSD